MDPQTLEKILHCPSLPSLPVIAAKVIELTSKADVKMDELAELIQKDQGVAAKILKTVNSSFYGLRTRCSTIQRALVMLGLGPVKTLALSFSIVSAIGKSDDGFDYESYWRRALYTAAAAKKIAHLSGHDAIAEECFLGGLLQDVGMLAMFRALGREYASVLGQTEGDHRRLVKCELAALEVQHPDIGAMLAARWKLPDELVLPVKYHERPTASPPKCTEIVRCVGLGNIVHDVLTDADPSDALRRAYTRAKEWFRLDSTAVDELVKDVAAAVAELSSLFNLRTGPLCDPETVIAKAAARLEELKREEPGAALFAGDADALTIDEGEVDPLTGVFNRIGFSSVTRSAFHIARTKNESLTLVTVALDGFDALVKSGPEEIDGEIAMGVTVLLKRHFDPFGGVIGRLGPDLFGVVVSASGRAAVTPVADKFRLQLDEHSQQWSIPDFAGKLRVTASVGLAASDPRAGEVFASPEQFCAAALRAAQAARAAGGNVLRAFVPRKAA